MKKAVVMSAAILAGAGLLAVYAGKEAKNSVVSVIDVQAADDDSDEVKTSDADSQTENEDIPVIDTELSIEAGMRIAVVSKSTKGQFWSLVEKGMQQAVADVNEAYGYKKDDQITLTFEGASDEEDVESQINTLDAVIAENPDVVCLSASDMDSCQAQLEAAKENGIPVVAFDSNVSDTKLIKAFRATNNAKVGSLGADKIAKAIGKHGKVAVFSAQGKTQSIQARVQGFTERLENYPDIQLVETLYADEVEDMETAMQELLEKYPTLDGVFCTNATISEMYLNMDKNENLDPVAMVGVDATSLQQEAIREGREMGCVSQNPYAIGYQTAWAALVSTVPKKEREDFERTVGIMPAWIDADSLEDPAYADYVYDK